MDFVYYFDYLLVNKLLLLFTMQDNWQDIKNFEKQGLFVFQLILRLSDS